MFNYYQPIVQIDVHDELGDKLSKTIQFCNIN